MEDYCEEVVRAEMHATLLFSTVLADAMALVQVAEESFTRRPPTFEISPDVWSMGRAPIA
jgi:hypothetical protein